MAFIYRGSVFNTASIVAWSVHSCDSCFCKSYFSFVFAHRTKESKNTVPSVIMINELPLILNVAGLYWVLCQDRLVDFFGGGGIGGGGGRGNGQFWAMVKV